jgi:hypothetical protein
VKYAGVLAPASRWGARLAPTPPVDPAASADEPTPLRRAGGYRPWAELLARTSAQDRGLAMRPEPQASGVPEPDREAEGPGRGDHERAVVARTRLAYYNPTRRASFEVVLVVSWEVPRRKQASYRACANPREYKTKAAGPVVDTRFDPKNVQLKREFCARKHWLEWSKNGSTRTHPWGLRGRYFIPVALDVEADIFRR